MRLILLFALSIAVLWAARAVLLLPPSWQSAGLAAVAVVQVAWLALLHAGGGWGVDGVAWRWRPGWIPLGVGAGLVLFVVSGAGYMLSERALGLSPPAELGLMEGAGWRRFALLLAVALTAAVLEERVFRELLFDALRDRSLGIRVVLTATLFAAYHGSLFQLVPTFLLGLGLALLVAMAGSLWPAVIAHGVFNVLGLTLTHLGLGAPGG